MTDYGQRLAPGAAPSPPRTSIPPTPPPASGAMTQPTNADMLTAINRLIDAINGLRDDLKPPSPGPARGLNTNIRALAEHKHQTGHRMGFGPVNVTEEQT